MGKKNSSPGILEKISFGLGDFSNNGIFTFVSTYLMFYYTDVAGLSLGAISIILFIGRAVDAVCSPLMGIVVDRTNTRWGKCRPFLGAGILPACILVVLMFSLPDGMGASGKALLAVGIYVLYSIVYAFMNVPYSTMISVLTGDNRERVSLNLFKTVGSNLGAIFVTAAALKAVERMGGAENGGFSKAALLFVTLFLLGSLMCTAFTRERVKQDREAPVKLRDSLRAVRENRPWLIFCGVQFLTLSFYIARNQGIIYYAKYFLGNEDIGSAMLTITSVMSLAVSFVLPAFSRRLGLRNCVITGNVIWCAAMAGSWFAGKSVLWVLAFHILASLGWSIATGMIFVLLAQTIDYSQWKSGVRPQGLFTSLLAFVQKIGIAFAGVACSQILNMGGYVANQAAAEGVLFSIKVLFCGLPLVFSLCVIVLMQFYHLDEIFPRIERDLQNGIGENGKILMHGREENFS